MDDRQYIQKEIEMLYQYMIDDGETFKKSKQIYNRLFKSIEGSITCEIGGLHELELSTQDIKDMIQTYVDEHPICLIKSAIY